MQKWQKKKKDTKSKQASKQAIKFDSSCLFVDMQTMLQLAIPEIRNPQKRDMHILV